MEGMQCGKKSEGLVGQMEATNRIRNKVKIKKGKERKGKEWKGKERKRKERKQIRRKDGKRNE